MAPCGVGDRGNLILMIRFRTEIATQGEAKAQSSTQPTQRTVAYTHIGLAFDKVEDVMGMSAAANDCVVFDRMAGFHKLSVGPEYAVGPGSLLDISYTIVTKQMIRGSLVTIIEAIFPTQVMANDEVKDIREIYIENYTADRKDYLGGWKQDKQKRR
ncbi:hypothetical protein BDZ45DRAFT_697293 [Acephala macrosclerotiorum]|nr:hypothetical protein BDZ45DRAFT_697293 [Acephala macrosclerotiorum]